MLEVMVSAILLTIGLVGMANLQISALNHNSNAYLRTIALIKADDIIDRMRANMTAVNNGNYDLPNVVPAQNLNCLGQTDAGVTDASLSCNSQQMAQHDLAEWQNDVQNDLPNGVGVICIDSTPNDGNPLNAQCDGVNSTNYVVKLWWGERVASVSNIGNVTTQTFIMEFQP